MMTKEWYIEFRRDQSRDMMEIYYKYYKMKGGTLSQFDFGQVFPQWVLLIGYGNNGFTQLQYFIFKTLNEYFVV